MKSHREFAGELRAAASASRRGRRQGGTDAGATSGAGRRGRTRWSWRAALLLWVVVLVFVSLAVWAHACELEAIVDGTGQVIPDSSKQVVQSLEGGIISEILVDEGDEVEKGDVLLRLNDTQFASAHRRNEELEYAIMARLTRLRAEARRKAELEFSPELKEKRPELVEFERELFQSRKRDYETRVELNRKRLEKEREKYELLRPSFDKGALPKADRLDLEAKILDLEEKLETTRTGFVREAMERYDEERERLITLLAEMEADRDRMIRTTMESPIDGVVNEIQIDTAGRVVKGGEPIMEIVPRNDTLLVEARIRPADIGFLHEGQEAKVYFTAYDFSIYGSLKGEIETIGADTVTDEKKEDTFYPIKVRTYRSDLGTDLKTGERLELVPGMVAEISVITGKRTVMDYLLKPINRARTHALRER